MMSRLTRQVEESAAVEELRMAVRLVMRRPPVALPNDHRRRDARLRMLLIAERRRSAALVEGLR